jgi:hypothetical protein
MEVVQLWRTLAVGPRPVSLQLLIVNNDAHRRSAAPAGLEESKLFLFIK